MQPMGPLFVCGDELHDELDLEHVVMKCLEEIVCENVEIVS